MLEAVETKPFLIKPGIKYAQAAPNEVYFQLMQQFIQSSTNPENRLLFLRALLKSDRVVPDSFFEDLPLELKKLSYPEIHTYIEILKKHKPISPRLKKQLIALLDTDNFINARKVYWFLNDQDLTEKQEKILVTFFRKNKDKL